MSASSYVYTVRKGERAKGGRKGGIGREGRQGDGGMGRKRRQNGRKGGEGVGGGRMAGREEARMGTKEDISVQEERVQLAK
jgi:hypothetical protein